MLTENKNWQSRTELLLGPEKLEKLKNKHVLVAGLGGVGSAAAEMLCRAGIGELTIVDNDTFHLSNLNRQLPATQSKIGHFKADVVAEKLLDINPLLKIHIVKSYLKDATLLEIVSHPYDYMIDAIDTFSPKTFFIIRGLEKGQKIVSSMGAGGKLDPLKIRVADISETHTCHLAFQLRKRLKRHQVRTGFKAVFSEESIIPGSMIYSDESQNKKTNVGTISYMPVIFGCVAASVVIRDLLEIE